MDSIVDIVIERAGGQGALARRLGVTTAALSQWRTKRRIPAERVLAVSRLTGLSPNTLRPDIYPDPAWALPEETA
jgi:DNA-binding transcriptional regulator YdaS (Cro superfamily)